MKYLRTEYKISPYVYENELLYMVTRYEVWKGWFRSYHRNLVYLDGSFKTLSKTRVDAKKVVEEDKIKSTEAHNKSVKAWELYAFEDIEVIL